MESKSRPEVCVTGGGGYTGSALVHSLLQNGYTVHTTLRNLGYTVHKRFKIKTRLFCVPGDESKNNYIVEVTINEVKKIADSCIRSGTVKRLIYTPSTVAASPLKDDGSGYKNTMDENCWTPLNLNVPYTNDYLKEFTHAKTEILKIGEEKENELKVVTLGCGMVGGGGPLPYPTGSVLMLISQIVNDATFYQTLRYLEELVGKIPIVHIEDICRAHIFCAETPSVNGRYLYASSYLEQLGRDIKWGSKKLEDKGFSY